MYLSSQKYITVAETLAIKKNPGPRYKDPTYPLELCPLLAELCGYITQCGTVTLSTFEINFTDIDIWPNIADRISTIYCHCWNKKYIRLNNKGHPRLSGKKVIFFIAALFGGLTYIKPGYEKVPIFIFDSLDQCEKEPAEKVAKAFLQGVLGPCPKERHYSNDKIEILTRLFFRSGELLNDIENLLKYQFSLEFKKEAGTLVFTEKQLSVFKKTIEIDNPCWWIT